MYAEGPADGDIIHLFIHLYPSIEISISLLTLVDVFITFATARNELSPR